MKTTMGTKICKHICAALSLVMLCGVPFAGTAYSAETEFNTPQTDEVSPASLDVSGDIDKFVDTNDLAAFKKSGKIDEQLCEILEKAEDDELIPVSIWINDIDFEEVEKRVEAEVGLSRNILEQKSDALRDDFVTSVSARLYSTNAVTAMSDSDFVAAFKDYKELNKAKVERFDEDVQSYTNVQRNAAKEMLIKSNSDFVDSFLGDAKDVCAYEYFPIIDCSITERQILNLASLSVVQSISSNADKDVVYPDWMIDDIVVPVDKAAATSAFPLFSDSTSVANAMRANLNTVNGYYTRDNLGFDGGRIKIGQIESGVPDDSVDQLKNADINIRGTGTKKEHATIVASIMIGKDGMAPGASLYSTAFDGSGASLRNCVQTLIGNGVSIINMSAHVASTDTEVARNLADFVVYYYNITWVCAAGNTGYEVNSPAVAYNVIAVGAIDTKGDQNPSNDEFTTYSSYHTNSTLSAKPEVVAPGEFYIGSGEPTGGTSLSTPIVTGLAAQMMSFSSEMIYKPEAIKAAIIASCDHKTPDITSTAHIDNKEGAGVVDALNAANSLSLMKLQNTYYTTPDNSKEFTLYPTTDGRKSVAISWLRKSSGNINNITLSPLVNFDLYVSNPNAGSYSSKSTTNGYEYVCFNTLKSYAYNVEIERKGSNGTTERIALAINR